MTPTDAFDDAIAVFYAHAIALENEAAQRYGELADQMEAHHNEAATRLFRWLAGLEAEHARELERKAEGIPLPRLKPWEYRWVDEEAPEAAPLDDIHYLMTPRHALEIALTNERRAREFFERYAESAEHPEVKRLATEMALDEAEHERYVERALARADEPDAHWDLDFDPPQTAE